MSDYDGSTNDRKAERGKPGQHAKRRVRWRSVWRRTREANAPAVAKLAEAEIAMKRRHVRAVTVSRVVRILLVGAALAAVIYARCRP